MKSRAPKELLRDYSDLNGYYPKDPFRSMVFYMIIQAKHEAVLDLGNIKTAYILRERAAVKREAIKFLHSEQLNYWLDLACIHVDPRIIRESIPGLGMVEELNKIIDQNLKKQEYSSSSNKNKIISLS